MKKSKIKEFSDLSQEAALRAEIGLQNARDTLPVLNAAREEQQLALNLIDGLVNKFLDLAKLLIAVSVPALVTLYSLKSKEFNSDQYVFITGLVLLLAIVMFISGMWYKFKYLPTYLNASVSRLNLYTEWIETATWRAKNEDFKLDHRRSSKKR